MDERISFGSMLLTIFMLMNAAPQIPIFLNLLSDYTAKKQRLIIIREMSIALLVLLTFIFFGSKVLRLLDVDHYVVGIAGGLLLILISLNMVFPKEKTITGIPALEEPFIVPLAIPCTAGPGTMTALMVFSEQQGAMRATSALIAAWLLSLIIILLSSFVKKYLGHKGLKAVERLSGMLIFLFGVQMIANGAIVFIKSSF